MSLLLRLPPPRSTLFPYTTLFRSRLARGEKRNKKRMSTVRAVFTQKPNIRTPEAVVESLFAESSKPHPTKRDRKSTRLNSSHMSISYAVFCLKKKNEYDTNTEGRT